MAECVKPPKYFTISSSENVAVQWKLWLQQFDWYAIATALEKKSPEVQVAIFMSAIGPDAAVIFNTFRLEKKEEESLETIKKKFTAHFTPKINETYERYVFNQIVQNDGQSIDDFVTNLKNKVKNCGYGHLEDSIIRDRVVIGVQSDIAREKLLSEDNLTLEKTINICHSTKQVRSHLESMKSSNAVNAITCNKKKKNINNNTKKEDEEFQCKRCDTRHGRRACPAFGKECKNCKKKNHFAKCCKGKKVESVTKASEKEESSEEDTDTLKVSTCEADIDTEDWYEKAYLQNNIMVKFKLDSGSQCNVITKRTAEKCQAEIRPTKTRHLTSFSGHNMTVLGEAIIKTRIKEITTEVKYLIVDSEVTPILGKATGVKLNLIRRVEAINVDEDLYDGIGCLKQYVYDIDLVDDPKLPICPARKVPHIIRKEVKEELDKMVKEKIIIPVTEPTPAVSPMVVVRKNDKIRLCIDPSEINKNLKRRHYPLNTIEEISARLHGSKWFTLLDCKKGFWQLKVTPRTSKYLTFSTPFGRYSCLRMPFGLASAPEVFQQVMSSLLAEIENVEVSMDDILIHAATKEDLEKRTERVLRKFKESGLKLNREKCMYNKEEIKFLGHILTKDGLKPDPEKLETIDKIKRPENVKELQRFLGLITYLSKFIKNLSDITAPLRVLLQKDIEWTWEAEQEEAFQELKRSLQKPPVLGYYDPKAPIILSVDASSYACGGVLIQNEKPIAYCAKSFTKTEQNYSQLEKETNAILVACKKFHNYIWGCKDITIESDHKPLQTIFKKPLPEAPPRLQRMFLQILPYNAKIVYKKGTEMFVADTLSRDCIDISQEEMDDRTVTICALLPFSKERKKELRQEIDQNDKEMIELKETILKGWPDHIQQVKENIKKYWYFRETLSVYNGIIFKDNRVLIPTRMIPLVMKCSHLSHKGVQGTIRLARDSVFWPNMTKDLTDYVSSCTVCAKLQKDNPMQPIMLQKAPDRPWSVLGSDIFHFKGHDYIVIADAYSGYFDFVELQNLTSTTVIKSLKSWFANFGIPDILLTDGGKQYDSEEFRKFTKDWNFIHRISSPHFPRSNGLAERYVQEAKNLLRKCREDGSDIQLALLHHRNTPREDLGSPCQRLMSRRTKSLLPISEQLLKPEIIKNVKKKLQNIKKKEKKFGDKGKKEAEEFNIGDKVHIRQDHRNWIPAEIIMPSVEPRSYIVKTKDGTYRRNSWHIKADKTSSLDGEHSSVSDTTATKLTVEPAPRPHPGEPSNRCPIVQPAASSQVDEHPSTQAPPANVAPDQPAIQRAAVDATPAPRTTRSGRAVVQPARYR